jgi:hypothetical protein
MMLARQRSRAAIVASFSPLHTQRVEFPNAAHWLNIEHAERFNQVVLDFLRVHPLKLPTLALCSSAQCWAASLPQMLENSVAWSPAGR